MSQLNHQNTQMLEIVCKYLEPLLDGRGNLISEISESNDDVRSFITTEIKKWLANDDFEDILPGMLLPDRASQSRLGNLIAQLSAISEL